jgi:eukaryotic-like serine/threonine-protein kinase
LCLYLGRECEYKRARRDLLARFGASADPRVAERTSRACLLLPATAEELRTALTLNERALGVDQSKNQRAYRNLLFVKGLAEFRQGQFDKAISIMRGDAAGVLGPAPRLVLAMALFRKGEEAQARRTLAAAIVNYNWRSGIVNSQEAFIFHVLRREAERLIVPKLPEFLAGKYQPRDNDERLALVGVCQYENRSVALVQLYADMFESDPRLAEDTQVRHRWEAACAAALAGCGRCVDAESLDEEARRRWRDQGRLWLHADLAELCKPQTDAAAASNSVKQWLLSWQANTDLAGVRELAELTKLSEDERRAWLALWKEVADAIKRM